MSTCGSGWEANSSLYGFSVEKVNKVPNSQCENMSKHNLYLYFKGSLRKVGNSDGGNEVSQGRPGSGKFSEEPRTEATLLLTGAGLQCGPVPRPPGAGPQFISCLPVCKQEGFSDGVGAALQLFGDTYPGCLGTCSPVNSVRCISLRWDDNFSFINTSKPQQLIYFNPHFGTTDIN